MESAGQDPVSEDLLVVGAGPAGLTGAIFARGKGLRVTVLEGLRAGGQLSTLYPHKPVYNYPGHREILGGELGARMTEQAREQGVEVREQTAVLSVERLGAGAWSVHTSRGTRIARALLLACGMGMFEPRRLEVPGERELADRSLFYSLHDEETWRGRRVVVVGGGDSAVDNANLLAGWGASVTLVHNLEVFQAQAASVDTLRTRVRDIHLGRSVRRIVERETGVEVEILSERDRLTTCITADRVLVNIGQKAGYAFLDSLTVAREGKRVRVDSEMRSSVDAIWACGDVASYPGKVRLIVTAIGEAATAVNSIEAHFKKEALPS